MKRPNLADLAAVAGSTRRQSPLPRPTEVSAPERGRQQVRTRVGTKQVAAHFPTEVAWQLRALAVERRTTVQDLMAEALNDLFAKYGKPELAPIGNNSRSGDAPICRQDDTPARSILMPVPSS
jgi:hypothetical protein